MHETASDLRALQELLDDSYRRAGRHLRRIHTVERRLNAREIAARLQGVCLLALATVTAEGRPVVGPVDGIFYRGSFYFGSAPDSLRLRHIAERPYVSATHVPGEHLAVTVHGRAIAVDLQHEAARGIRQTLLSTYVPRYGEGWEQFMDSSRYMRIVATRCFAFAAPAH